MKIILANHEFAIERADSLLGIDEYIHLVKELVRSSIQHDPTLVLHPDDVIAKKYHRSMVAIDENRIIANTSIYPTNMKPLNSLIDSNGNPILVGECGSTVVEIGKRYKGIGKFLAGQTVETLGGEYDILVSATINGAMEKIRKSLGFEEVPFPKEYYEEGKKHLSPLLPGGLQEFEQRAKCLMLFQNSNESYKQYVLDILNNHSTFIK